MLGTETASNNEDRGEYDAAAGYVSSYDTSQEIWWGDQIGKDKTGWTKGRDLRAFMIGGFDWTGLDYKGECHWPSVNSHFAWLLYTRGGAVDRRLSTSRICATSISVSQRIRLCT